MSSGTTSRAGMRRVPSARTTSARGLVRSRERFQSAFGPLFLDHGDSNHQENARENGNCFAQVPDHQIDDTSAQQEYEHGLFEGARMRWRTRVCL